MKRNAYCSRVTPFVQGIPEAVRQQSPEGGSQEALLIKLEIGPHQRKSQLSYCTEKLYIDLPENSQEK